MKAIISTLTALVLVFAFGSQSGFAAGAGKTGGMSQSGSEGTMGATSTMHRGAAPRASEIIGKNVTNSQKQDLGECEDLILSSDGRVSYLIISKGGLAGVGDKKYAIPWQAADVRVQEDNLLVDVTKDRLEGAPNFADWDEFKSGAYESRVRAYYGEGGFSPGERPMQSPKAPSSN
jgi:sporulation protein YlmC with PRC-barrel domain